jgi:AcrR family transcriptional regulator
MARWEPGTKGRLAQAALEQFATRGFEQTTAAEIAESVGLTERTFFRHFADKREVLFDGQELFLQAFVSGAAAAPAGAPPMDVMASALESAAAFFTDDRREFSRARQAVIDANPALQERERHKAAALATVLRDALLAREITDPTATLAAESAATVFHVAFQQWVRDGEERSLTDITTAVLGELRAIARSAN